MLKRAGKWLLILYLVQAFAGVGIGVALAVMYGADGPAKLERIIKHLGEVANAEAH